MQHGSKNVALPTPALLGQSTGRGGGIILLFGEYDPPVDFYDVSDTAENNDWNGGGDSAGKRTVTWDNCPLGGTQEIVLLSLV